jgi:hypothetical protein
MALQGETTNREFRHGSLISLLSDNRKEFKKRTKTGILDDSRKKCLSLQLLRISKVFGRRGRPFVCRDYRS